MKYLALFIAILPMGCQKNTPDRSTEYISVACIGTKSLGNICKFTTRNGHSTCVADQGRTYSVSIDCEFYENITKETK